jgi:hypothetical protein
VSYYGWSTARLHGSGSMASWSSPIAGNYPDACGTRCRPTLYPPGDWKEQHEEVSGTIRRVMLVLLGYGFFCALALGAPDASLIAANAQIEVPFANTNIAFASFLLIGPLVLLGIAFYLHLFVGRWVELNRYLKGSNQGGAGRHYLTGDRALGPQSGENGSGLTPYAFNLDNSVARFFTGFVFYWLVPLVFLGFAYKASPRSEGSILAVLTLVVTLAFLLLQTRRAIDTRAPLPTRIFRWLVMGTMLAAALLILRGYSPFDRRLNLSGATLKDEDLSAANLSGVDLRRSNLENSALRRVDLFFADLRGAILAGSDFGLANLVRADLRGIDLTGVKNLTQG